MQAVINNVFTAASHCHCQRQQQQQQQRRDSTNSMATTAAL